MKNLFCFVCLSIVSCSDKGGESHPILYSSNLIGKSKIARWKLEACGGKKILWDFSNTTITETNGVKLRLRKIWEDRINQILEAKDCEAVISAYNGGKKPETCSTLDQAICDKDVQRTCTSLDRPYFIDIDCASVGLSCIKGQCAFSECTRFSCISDDYYDCYNGYSIPFLCSAFGLTCGQGIWQTWCQGKGGECANGIDKPNCDNGILRFCLLERWAEVDCKGLSGGKRTCDSSWVQANQWIDGTSLLAYYLGSACILSTDECNGRESICEGSDIIMCIDGRFEHFSCSSYGFKGCQEILDYGICVGFPG